MRAGPPSPYHVQPPVRVSAPPPVARRPSWRMVIKTVLAFGMATFIVQLLVGLAALVYGTTIVLPEIVHASYTLYIIMPFLVGIGQISGELLAAYYLVVVAAILASATWLFLGSASGFHKELNGKGESRKHSAVFDLCGLMFAVLFLNVVVVLLVSAVWGEPESPTEEAETWELLFLLANASVWEELVVRVLLLGVPLLLIDLTRHTLQAKRYRYFLGGGFSLGLAEVSLLIISSAMFGIGHYEGWGAWKVFPSAVAGAAFAYLFLRHGLAAAIMLHFGFDYLYIPTEVFVQGSQTAALVILGVAVLAWLAMGAVFFGYYILRMAEFVTKRKYFEEPPPRPAPYPYYYGHPVAPPAEVWGTGGQGYQVQWQHPPMEIRQAPAPPPGPGGFFVCPACGGTEARLTDGQLQCLRCGTRI